MRRTALPREMQKLAVTLDGMVVDANTDISMKLIFTALMNQQMQKLLKQLFPLTK